MIIDERMAAFIDSLDRGNTALLDEIEKEAMLRMLKEEFARYTACFPKIGGTISKQVEEGYDLGMLLDQITINIPLNFKKKQQVLGAVLLRE